ncbi:MAG: WecB/TagA/CpsF glycosyl transferase [Puniceicoccaceae bacterium 5H]|nr:MAG: WecB/TagA/CpsF glycosyl transferase [Puniceicoccaceae bacterium 5H]
MNQRDIVVGIPFFRGTCEEAIDQARQGGLVVAPSGPGLAQDWPRDVTYRDAISTADLILVDSGYLALCWWMMSGYQLNRISGLRFFQELVPSLTHEEREPGVTFWVMPSADQAEANREWLNAQGIAVREQDCYVAPDYSDGAVEDPDLLAVLNEKRPRWVFLNVGGGVQEPLGHWLRQNLDYRPAIVCTGAAIAFLSGQQAPIPDWADRLYLGWLARSVRNPLVHGRRYLDTLRLPYVLRHKNPRYNGHR